MKIFKRQFFFPLLFQNVPGLRRNKWPLDIILVAKAQISRSPKLTHTPIAKMFGENVVSFLYQYDLLALLVAIHCLVGGWHGGKDSFSNFLFQNHLFLPFIQQSLLCIPRKEFSGFQILVLPLNCSFSPRWWLFGDRNMTYMLSWRKQRELGDNAIWLLRC